MEFYSAIKNVMMTSAGKWMVTPGQRIRTAWEGSESALPSLSDSGLYT